MNPKPHLPIRPAQTGVKLRRCRDSATFLDFRRLEKLGSQTSTSQRLSCYKGRSSGLCYRHILGEHRLRLAYGPRLGSAQWIAGVFQHVYLIDCGLWDNLRSVFLPFIAQERQLGFDRSFQLSDAIIFVSRIFFDHRLLDRLLGQSPLAAARIATPRW